MHRHLLTVDDLSRDDIERILGRAESFAEVSGREIKKVPTLRGRTVINLFYEASTRTQSSFELAAKRLSADLVTIKAAGSAVEKGESLKDTVQTLSAYDPAAIVIRTPHAGAAGLVARWTRASVINAGDGKHEHPTQALLDLYTLKRRAGSLEGLRVWIVGDVLHSRVARSNMLAFTRMGCEVTVCGPPTLIPRGIESLGCQVRHTLDELPSADVVYALRMQHERMTGSFVPSLREYAASLPDRRPPPGPEPAPDAPRTGQPRGRALRRGDRLAPGAHHRAGGVGRGGAHGGAVRAPGRPRARRRLWARAPRRSRSPHEDRHERGRGALELDRAGAPAGTVLLRGARLLDPRAGLDSTSDLLIRDGRVAEIGDSLEAPEGAERVDAEGLHAFPAFVDPHVHLRTPGREDEEDLDSGTRAAAAGGFCAIIAQPNTEPVVDSAPILRSLRERARAEARIPTGFMAAITVGQRGEGLTEMAELADSGAAGFTDDGLPVRSAGVLRQALQYQRLARRVIALHEEDPALSAGGAMHEGEVSALLGVAGIPSLSESTMVARDCALALYEGGRIHVQHVSAQRDRGGHRARPAERHGRSPARPRPTICCSPTRTSARSTPT